MRFYCSPRFELLSARKRKGDGDFDIVAEGDKCLGTYGMKLSGWVARGIFKVDTAGVVLFLEPNHS